MSYVPWEGRPFLIQSITCFSTYMWLWYRPQTSGCQEANLRTSRTTNSNRGNVTGGHSNRAWVCSNDAEVPLLGRLQEVSKQSGSPDTG